MPISDRCYILRHHTRCWRHCQILARYISSCHLTLSEYETIFPYGLRLSPRIVFRCYKTRLKPGLCYSPYHRHAIVLQLSAEELPGCDFRRPIPRRVECCRCRWVVSDRPQGRRGIRSPDPVRFECTVTECKVLDPELSLHDDCSISSVLGDIWMVSPADENIGVFEKLNTAQTLSQRLFP